MNLGVGDKTPSLRQRERCFLPLPLPLFPGSPRATLAFLEFSPEGCATLLSSRGLVPGPHRVLTHNGALSPDVPVGFRSESSSCHRRLPRRSQARAWQAAPGDDRAEPATQKSPKKKAAAGMRTQARITQHSPCWKTRTHLRTGPRGRNGNPTKAGGRTLVADTFTPLEWGGFSSFGLSVCLSLCHVTRFTFIRNLCYSAFPPHFFFFFF